MNQITVKLEFSERNCAMRDRLANAAKRITALKNGAVPGSTRILQKEQIGVYADFALFLQEIAEYPHRFNDKPPTGRIVLPPRTGKTVIAGQILSGAGMMTTIIVPTRTLVQQTARELRQQLPNVPVGIYYGEEKGLVMWGVNVTTYSILQNRFKQSGGIPHEIAFSSLVIADEGHQAMTVDRQKLIKECFDPLAVRVALTATPNYSRERRLAAYFQHLIHEITISEAIELEMVAPLRVWMAEVDVDASTVQVVRGDYEDEKLGRLMSAAPFFEATRVFRYEEGNREKPALICCASRQQAYDLYKYLLDHRPSGTLEPELILGETKKEKREKILEQFEQGSVDTIINVGVLVLGWNSPRCKLLIDLAPSSSWVRATQKFFRPLTKCDDREAAIYMLLPKGLPELPVIPMDLFEWNMPEFEQGVLIASKQKREQDKRQPGIKRTAHSPIEKVTLRSRIVFEGLFERPKLDPGSHEQIRAVLESNPQIKRNKIPHYSEFRWLVFRHPLYKGRGMNLLRYCGVQMSRFDYALFMARFFPEGASDLYADRNYNLAASIRIDTGSCYDDLHRMRSELRKGRRGEDFEQGWLALGDSLRGGCESAEDICIRWSILPKVVRKVLGTLTPREERVIEMRFGIGCEEHTLEEAAQEFEVIRERIRQIEVNGLRKLRHPSRANLLKDFWPDSVWLTEHKGEEILKAKIRAEAREEAKTLFREWKRPTKEIASASDYDGQETDQR